MTEQTPEVTPETKPEAEKAPEQPVDEGKGGKSAILADLATERRQRQALEQQINELRQSQVSQSEALAKALGFDKGEKPAADALAEQVGQIQARLDAAERKSNLLTVAQQHGIPQEYQHLLTATDSETLTAQATALADLVKSRNPAAPTPDPSQGAQPLAPQAEIDAEYAKFFPSTPNRK